MKIIELLEMRNRMDVFKDRSEAGMVQAGNSDFSYSGLDFKAQIDLNIQYAVCPT
jgi:hypothetical protein